MYIIPSQKSSFHVQNSASRIPCLQNSMSIQQNNEIFKTLFNKKEKNYTNKNEIIKEYIPQDEIKNLIQEDLPFIKAENTLLKDRNNYKLPSLELLKTPSNNERKKMDKNDTFLLKI